MNCHFHPEVPSVAFCQFCGKPLCKDCVRNVGGAVYCETCLAERLRTTSTVGASFSTGTPHPMLAAILGFIPGVGAMYNGQFAKGIAHVLIFAVLASLSDHVGIFGILVAAWVFYQVFDAYQTAIARRDGLPLPNPFGLNDIAQRLGVHPHPVPPAPGATWDATAQTNWDPTAQTNWNPVAGANWSQGAPPPAGFTPSAGFVPPAAPPPPGYVPAQPYVPVPPVGYADVARRDLPVGAIVLIGLGVLFLFGSLGLLRFAWIGHLWPLLIIGLGIWILVRRARSVPADPIPPMSAPDPRVPVDPAAGGPR